MGAFLVLLGLMMLSYNYVEAKHLVATEYMDKKFYEKEKKEEESTKVEKEAQTEIPQITNKKESNTQPETTIKKEYATEENNNYYIGYLEIPKIHFRKGLVDKDSKENNVEKNLFITSDSVYPDVEKGNLIIAGHSGNSYKSFFRNLYQLAVTDIAKVEFQNKTYTYQITKIYEQQKTGRIAIYRDYDKTTLTLVTCTKDNDEKQTVYILELINVE